MPRKFHNTNGVVYRAVIEFRFKGDKSNPLRVEFGPYTRQNDASAQLTTQSAIITRPSIYGEREIIRAEVEVGTITWTKVPKAGAQHG